MNFGIIGYGKMGGALVEAILKSGLISPEKVTISNRRKELLQKASKSLGVTVADTNKQLVEQSDVILLGTKPNDLLTMLEQDVKESSAGKLFISIAAGLKISAIEAALDTEARVIRSMPNTPSLIGKGATAFACGDSVTNEDRALCNEMLSVVGIVTEVEESLLDAVTGLSGSGPAYVYTFIESLVDGAVGQGLSRQQALELATQTVIGAATMVQETNMQPAELRDRVTSPGGTTIEGLRALEETGFKASVIAAVDAATIKSKKLGS